MTDVKKAHATTAICGYDADHICIRGKDLVHDIMGHYSFTELLILQALGRESTEMQNRIVDSVMVAIMEHGLVPSAIAARLTLHGAPESFQGAVAAGLLGIGDRYAGTASECGEILERIVATAKASRKAKSVDEVEAYRQRGRPVPGFGHPIHEQADSRVDRLLEIATDAGASGDYMDAMKLLESTLREVTGKPLVTNISAAIAAVLGEAGVPSSLMRGIVLTARCAGLAGHLLEETENPAAHDMWQAAQSVVDYQD